MRYLKMVVLLPMKSIQKRKLKASWESDMEEIIAKSILQNVSYKAGWFGVDYNMNLYRGCCHGCIYCDSRSSCYGIDHFDTVRIKKDALLILENEMRRMKDKINSFA